LVTPLNQIRKSQIANFIPGWRLDKFTGHVLLTHSYGQIEALGESNYQLLAIGRNLNQIAKNLNRGLQLTVTIEQIESLRKLIKDHTKRVSCVLRASVERWSIK
jgi:hypothetical protein